MKKIICCLLSLVLVASILPSALAAVIPGETAQQVAPSYDVLLAKACEAFPNHAADIVSFNGSIEEVNLLSDVEPVVCKEEKSISDTETLTYIEYRSGVTNVIFTRDIYTKYTSTGSATETKCITVSVLCNLTAEDFCIGDFIYTRALGAPDYINSFGTNISTCGVTVLGKQQTETESSHAYIRYRAKFTPLEGMGTDGWTGYYYAEIMFDVGGDQFVLTVDGQ